MNKYFKNDKRITIPNLLKIYENYRWGDYPDFKYNKQQAERLIGLCDESDQYLNWKQQCNQLQEKCNQIKTQLMEIQANQVEIKLKNSEEEYQQVWKQLNDERYRLENQLTTKKSKAPKSKYDLLKKLYDDMEKARKAADDELIEREKQSQRRCRCDGFRCQC